jgi:hypothetical protein
VKRYEKYGKYGRKVFFFYKTINTACNSFKFTLCPTNLHIKSYSPYFNIILTHRVVTYSPHKELCPLLQSYPFKYRVIPLTEENRYI